MFYTQAITNLSFYMKNHKFIFLLMFNIFGVMVHAQSPIGTWVTIDDRRKVDIAHVKIYEDDGMLYGKVTKLLPQALTRTCEGCSGKQKDQSVVGMVMIKDVKPDGDNYWSQGNILDPKSGRFFNCSMWLDDPNTLKVRGSFGISLIGRTQTWKRLF